MDALKRFFAPQVAQMIFDGADDLLQPHRRRVAVASIDLRGFTQFSESAEPEEVMEALRQAPPWSKEAIRFATFRK